jgi:hypothetical protein
MKIDTRRREGKDGHNGLWTRPPYLMTLSSSKVSLVLDAGLHNGLWLNALEWRGKHAGESN